MRSLRLFAFAALAFAAACSNDVTSPAVAPEEGPEAAAAYIPNPLFQLNFSSLNAFFSTPNENEVPSSPAKIVMFSPYAAFATLGPPRVVKVEYSGGPGGWLTGNVEVKSAFQADLNLRVTKGMPIGAYQAKITLTLLGVVNYVVNASFVSGVYFFDGANSTAGWTFTGFWHQTAGGTSVNPRGPHPGPDEGSGFFGYYSEATGDFDFGLNSGAATSPAFVMPAGAQNPVVRVRTWFEIEYDVSPFSYDYMEFYLVEEGNPANRIFLGRINGSGFFAGNGTTFGLVNPWIDVQFPIPPAAFGDTWHLELFFDTRDGAYNDYRGWGVDNIQIIEGGAPPAANFGAATARRAFERSLIPGSEIPVVERESGLIKR